MLEIGPQLVELIRLASVDLPMDVEVALQKVREQEKQNSPAREAMDTIMENIRMARAESIPICQDTGTLIFYVHYPFGLRQLEIRNQINIAVEKATELGYLRPNVVETLSGKNTGNNLGDEFHPTIHFFEKNDGPLVIELLLKGGGCENVGCQYRLPDSTLKAARDLDGVRRVVLDAVYQAQGKGCAPGFLGVAIGGDRSSSFLASKDVFLRKVNEENPDRILADLEQRITAESNQLGIGPMGFGGHTTIVRTFIRSLHRIPASYFVSISYMCWAFRRRKMVILDNQVSYE